MLNITQGNPVPLGIQLRRNGADFAPESEGLRVLLTDYYGSRAIKDVTVADGRILATVPATVRVGKYGIEITGTQAGSPWRTKYNDVLNITDETVEDVSDEPVTMTGDYYDIVMIVNFVERGAMEQVQADWNQTNPEEKSYIRNKPTIPDVPSWAMQPTKPSYTAEDVDALPSDTFIPSKTSELENDSGFLTQHQSLAAYEKKMDVIANPSLVGNTLAISVNQLGSYYRLEVSAPTTITLPDMANETVTTITGVIVNITLSTGGSLTLSATQPIYESGLADIEEGATFEINAIYNGSHWAVTATKLELYNPS